MRLTHNQRSELNIQLLVVLAIGISTAGCSSLTKSQVKETKTFATAASAFVDTAGKPGTYLGKTRRAQRLIGVAGDSIHSPNFGEATPDEGDKVGKERFESVWSAIESANEVQNKYDAAVKELHAKLDVLEVYAEALHAAASANHSAELNKSAEAFGKSMNKAIEAHNFVVADNSKKLSPVAAISAGTVRGIGGLYVKHRQAKIVKLALKEGNKFVQNLTEGYAKLLSQDFPTFFGKVEESLKQQSKNLYVHSTGFEPATAVQIADILVELQTATQLSRSVANSALKLGDAHAALLKSTNKRKSLKHQIEEIRSLVDEVKEAQKVAKKLEQK